MSVLEPKRGQPWVESPYMRSLLVSSILLSYHIICAIALGLHLHGCRTSSDVVLGLQLQHKLRICNCAPTMHTQLSRDTTKQPPIFSLRLHANNMLTRPRPAA